MPGAEDPSGCVKGFAAAKAGLETVTVSSVTEVWPEPGLTVVSLLACSVLSRYKPRTTSDIRFSSTGSPCVLTTQPGRGGKLDAAKSNFGGDGVTLTSASGTGLTIRSSSRLLLVPL